MHFIRDGTGCGLYSFGYAFRIHVEGPRSLKRQSSHSSRFYIGDTRLHLCMQDNRTQEPLQDIHLCCS